MEVGENYVKSKDKGPSEENFPWSHFASLAMHIVINQWAVKSVVDGAIYAPDESTVIKPQSKVNNHLFTNNFNLI